MFSRTQTRSLRVGAVPVGGGAPVSVQSMAKADPHDAKALVAQIGVCVAYGCDIFRLAVPDMEAVFRLSKGSPPLLLFRAERSGYVF